MIPKSITIYGVKYKVKIDPKLESAGLFECQRLDKKNLISIFKDDIDSMLYAYLHECLHGVFEEGRVNEVVPPEIEEVIAEQTVKFLLKNFTVEPKYR